MTSVLTYQPKISPESQLKSTHQVELAENKSIGCTPP